MSTRVEPSPLRFEFRHQRDRALLEGRAPEEIADLAIAQLRASVSCAWACALLVDLGAGETRVLASSRHLPPQLRAGKPMPLATFGIAAEVADQDIAGLGLALDPDVDVYGAQDGWSLLRIPLTARSQTIGVLDVAVAAEHAPQLTDLMGIRAMADELAIAIQVARLLTQTAHARDTAQLLAGRLVEVAETERRAIAGELHDQIGQELTALLLLLERATQGGAEQRQQLISAQAITRLLIERTRDLALDLRPALLDSLGLLPALLAQQEHYTKQTGLVVTLEHQAIARRFPGAVETAAYRIVQEALTNIARHAGVRVAHVRLWADRSHLFVQVHDQGRGFNVADVRGGFGLTNMRERALLLGGSFEIESIPERGTRITAIIPTDRP